MAEPVVLYEVKDQIAYITLNRPEKRNALNKELSVTLRKTWQRFEEDTNAWVAILRGAGKGFCSGWDLTPGAATPDDTIKAVPENGRTILKPIIGAVHGFAIGAGWALAIRGCDLTIAAEGTEFSFPEARVGAPLNPVEYFPYLPFKISMEFFLISAVERMSAQRAYEFGFINKVVSEADLMTEAIRLAEMIKKIPPLAVRAIKYGHYKALDNQTMRSRWEYLNFVEPQIESEDIKEARNASIEKRTPLFKGK